MRTRYRVTRVGSAIYRVDVYDSKDRLEESVIVILKRQLITCSCEHFKTTPNPKSHKHVLVVRKFTSLGEPANFLVWFNRDKVMEWIP